MKIMYKDEKVKRINLIDVREDGRIYISLRTKSRDIILRTNVVNIDLESRDKNNRKT